MPNKFAVEAYNLSAKPIKAAMTGWMIAPGTWKMSGKGMASKTFTFERSTSVDLTFAPHKTTLVNFEMVTPEPSTANRPDIGIGPEDVAVEDGMVNLTVHSLGALDAPVGTAKLIDAKGNVLARVAIPAIPAPLDLEPKTVKVALPIKPGAVCVEVGLDNGVKEITALNNVALLPHAAVTAKPAKPTKAAKRSKHH
jgi:hypothetical protein